MRRFRPASVALAPLALATTLTLGGCFLLPEAPTAVPTSATPSAEPAEDVVVEPLINCTRTVMEIVLALGAGDPRDVRTVREIAPEDFAPSSLERLLRGSCVYEVTTVEVGGRTTMSQGAFISGGFDLYDSIGVQLQVAGYEDRINPVSTPTPTPTPTAEVDGVEPAPALETPPPAGESHPTYSEYYDEYLCYVAVWHSGGEQMLVELTGHAFDYLGGEYIVLFSVEIADH